MHVVIKGKSLTDLFTEIAEAYHMDFPELAAEFTNGVKTSQYGLKRANGMSDEGQFMELGMIPEHLYGAVKRAAQLCFNLDDCWRDPANMRLFFKVWQNAAIKRKPTKILDVKEARRAD